MVLGKGPVTGFQMALRSQSKQQRSTWPEGGSCFSPLLEENSQSSFADKCTVCVTIQPLINAKIQAPRVEFKLQELPTKSTVNELVTSEERLQEVECDHISLLQSDTLLCLEQH